VNPAFLLVNMAEPSIFNCSPSSTHDSALRAAAHGASQRVPGVLESNWSSGTRNINAV